MKVPAIRTMAMWAVLIAAPLLWGCSKPENANPPAPAVKDDHSGWWCPEHGVPEKICAQCDTSLVDDFKKKGDWCAKHNRPESQCFTCHPEHEAKFAAQYEAKYGKKPPQREEEAKDEKKEKSS